MGHSHDHHHATNKKALFWSFLAIFTFMFVEAIGGFLPNSLALLSDAGHVLRAASALGLIRIAFEFGSKQATYNKTCGFRRFQSMAALANGIQLIAISLYIFYEALQRFTKPHVVSASMMIIATIGLVVNVLLFFILMRGDS